MSYYSSMLKEAYENGVRAALEKYAQETIQDRYARWGVSDLTPDQLAWMARTEPGQPVSLPNEDEWTPEQHACFMALATPDYDPEQWTEAPPVASWSTGGLPSGGG